MAGLGLLVAWAAGAIGWGLPLALTRHFHVDEFQAAYNAALWGLHRLPELSNYAAPFLVPLASLAARGGESWPLLIDLRVPFYLLFLVNLALVAVAARVPGGLVGSAAVLIGVTLVEPLWRHGFEIRHDGVLLATSLALFALTRRAAEGRATSWIFFLAGLAAATAQANSFKAFLYWPAGLALVALFAAASGKRPSWPRVGIALAAGALAGAALNLGLLALSGHLDTYLGLYRDLVASAAGGRARFAPTLRLLQALLELPILLLLAVWAFVRLAAKVRSGHHSGWVRAAVAPAWLALQLVAIHLNPAPYSYNFVHVLPFLFLVAVDGLLEVLSALEHRRAVVVAGALVAMGAAFSFDLWRDPLVRLRATAQRSYIEAAEALTTKDEPVLDGVGMVLSRRPPGKHWMLHSLYMRDYRAGERVPFRELLTRAPAPVLMTNYRWEWLGREDREFVRSRYLELWPRFLVLGGTIPAGATQIEVPRGGRYRMSVAPGATVTVAGRTLAAGGVVDLAAGRQQVEVVGGEARFAWLGATQADFPRVLPLPATRDLFLSD